MIYYTNKRTENFTEAELDKIIIFIYDYLEIPEDVVFNLEFSSNFPEFYFAECYISENKIHVSVNETVSKEDMLRSIFHESVHTYQILSGIFCPEKKSWQNIPYFGNYIDSPWEKEAFDLEEKMYFSYLQTSKIEL
jgi:hypothetical protein